MENLKIREQARTNGIRMWQIAERLGIHEGNFSRKLRRELPLEEQKKILGIISDLAAERTEVS